MNNKLSYGLLIIIFIIFYLFFLQNQLLNLHEIPFSIIKHNNNQQTIFQSFQSRNVSFNIKSVIYENVSSNPTYNYYLYNDYDCRKFIHNNFDLDVLYAFDKLIPGAYKSDLWRYCVLYINGGVYLDIKFKIIKPLHTYVKKDTIIFVKDLVSNNIYNAIMIASPNLPIFKHAINNIVHNVKNNYYGNSPLDPTGPELLGKLIKKHNYTKYVTLYLATATSLYQEIKNIKTNEIYFQSYLMYRLEQYFIQKKKHYHTLWHEKKIYYSDNELKNLTN